MTDYEQGKHAKHVRPGQASQSQQPRQQQQYQQQSGNVAQPQDQQRYQYKGYSNQQARQQAGPQPVQPGHAARQHSQQGHQQVPPMQQPNRTQAMPQQGAYCSSQPYGQQANGRAQGGRRVNPAQQAQFAQYSRNTQANRNGYSAQGHSAYPGQGGPGQTGVISMPQKKRKGKKIVIGVLIAVLVLIGAGVAAGAVYLNTIAGNMALSGDVKKDLENVLSTSENPYEKPFYVLLMGSDNWESYGERSDAIVLLRVDKNNHQITMVSVPRDTPYMLNGNKVKLNQAFAEDGAVGAVKAVEELTGVDISYYAEIEFAGLKNYVDSIGGIEVNVPYAIDYQVYTMDQDVVHIEAGDQILDGEEAIALARMRTAYKDTDSQDAVRQSNVRALAIAMMNSIIQAPVTEIPSLVQNLSSCIKTSMDMNTMVSLATDFAQAKNDVKLYTCTGPYKGDIDKETGLWLCYEDKAGWKDLMSIVDSGGNPKESDAATQVEGK